MAMICGLARRLQGALDRVCVATLREELLELRGGEIVRMKSLRMEIGMCGSSEAFRNISMWIVLLLLLITGKNLRSAGLDNRSLNDC